MKPVVGPPFLKGPDHQGQEVKLEKLTFGD
jgi:hypothetical protein